jgi:hypothetical protein
MAEETTNDERNEERETLLAALEVADTPPGEETPIQSEELASDASESEEPADTPDPEPEAEAEVTEETSEEPSNREKKAENRLNKGWDKLNAGKATLKQEVEEFEAQKQQHTDDQTSPEEYRELASQYTEDGQKELAELAEEKAQEVEQRRQQKQVNEGSDEVKAGWNSNLKDLQEQHPDLLEDSDLTNGVEAVLDQRPFLRGYPEGIQDAVAIAKSNLGDTQVKSLEKTNGDLKTEIEELKQQTSVTGSPPGREAAPKGPSEGSQEQIRGKLLEALQQADTEGAGLKIFR